MLSPTNALKRKQSQNRKWKSTKPREHKKEKKKNTTWTHPLSLC